MGAFREYRNIEASLIEYLTAKLVTDGWSGISVGKTFSLIEDSKLPAIIVQLVSSTLKRKEIGSSTFEDTEFLVVRIFATSDGQRLDLAKWLIDNLAETIPYYTYTIIKGAIASKELSGSIRVTKIVENKKELEGVPDLHITDRYRHKISFNVKIN